MNTRIFGHVCCSRCGAPELDVVAYKTGGLCATCFRDSPVMREIIAVTRDGERIALRLDRRTPGERAQRRRGKDRAKMREDQREKRRLVTLASTRAKAALTRVFPEIYEVLLAEERAKLALTPWTIDKALTPHRVTDETMAIIETYHAREQKADRC